jgi:hypothetical protein
MPARKMRVELFDNEGNRYTVAFEGQVTRDKALRLLDLVELLGGMPGGQTPSNGTGQIQPIGESSRFDKVRFVVQKNFPLVWFSSKDIQSVYEQELKEPVSLSTVSTYLARMANKGFLMRSGSANSIKYKTSTTTPQAVIKQKLK